MAKVSSKKFMGISREALAEKVSINSQKITLLKNIIKAQKIDIGKKLASLSGDNPLDNSIESIKTSVLSIKETLEDQHELDKDQADLDRVADQQKKRNLKEKLGENVKGAGKSVVKGVGAVVAPLQGAFEQMFGWLTKLIAAKVVMEMIDWFSDEGNIGKIKTLVRFAKDWWPVLLTAAVGIVAAVVGPTGIAIGLSVLLLGFLPKIIDATKKFLGITKGVNKEAKEGEAAAKAIQKGEDSLAADVKPNETVEETVVEGEKKEESPTEFEQFNQGGQVPGSGDRDTVPAMLTPGEFVMSKDAVSAWGSDTFAGMNAAAGGKNTGSPSRGFKEGGEVKNPRQWLAKHSPLSKKENKEGIISKGFGFLKSAFGGGKKSKILKGGLNLFIDKISNLPIVGPKLAEAGKDLVTGVQEMIATNHVALHKHTSISSEQNKREGVSPPTKPPVTVAYANAADKAETYGGLGKKAVGDAAVTIPYFDAGAKVSPHKVKVLGITR
tara:strand:+ start:31 stop:1518 length:1488 start_codon:yes stop_codon:yes gene_type:complete